MIKMMVEDSNNILRVMFPILWSSEDLFCMGKYLLRRGNQLQDTRCSVCTGQAHLTHSRHPRVSRFLGVNKNCTVHTEATLISICMLNSWSRRWKHCTTEVQSPSTFLRWRSVSTIVISCCQDITSRVSPLLGCPHFTTPKNKTNLKTQSFLRLKNTVW